MGHNAHLNVHYEGYILPKRCKGCMQDIHRSFAMATNQIQQFRL